MKKKLVCLVIAVGLIALLFSSCSMIGLGGSSTAKPPPSKTTTTPTLIERIQALESENISLNTQVSKLNADVTELQSKLANDEKTIADLKNISQ
jgi:peptidoglycan hydrolase CwlO-like protein